jgi:PAS domain S-box-containing protein
MLSILYVDDDDALLDVGKTFLEMSGTMQVETAHSAEHALSLVGGGGFDAIISDYEMPVMNGIEFLQCLRREGNTVPFLIFTGRGREDVAVEAFHSGADYYIQKGGDIRSQFAELIHKVRKAVERRRTAAELERSNSLLLATLEATADGILAIDTEGKLAACNRKFLDMWGIPGPVTTADPPRHLIPALAEQTEDPVQFIRRINEINMRPESTSYDIIRCRDGRVFRCFSQIQKTGTVMTGRVWSFRDITRQDMADGRLRAANEQLAATEEELKTQYAELGKQVDLLRESEEKYRAVFDTDPVPLLVADTTATALLDVNSAACRVYGYTRDGMLRLSVRDLLPDSPGEGNDVDWEIFLRAPAHRRRDGSLFPVSVSCAPLILQGRQATILSVQDITPMKMIEDALKLTNIRLNLLLGITRHDILNNLTVLVGYNEILSQKIDDAGIHQILDLQLRATAEIRNHIDFTREYDSLGIRGPSWQCVEDIASRAFDQFLKTITFDSDVRSLEIYADPLIEKVFYNLFDNAFRYGGGISVVTLSCRQDGTALVLAFSDDGIGVPAEEKERIFRRGYGKNTGLGLFLAREILSITGMEIHETGESGRGACFEILVSAGYYRFRGPARCPPGMCRPEEIPLENGCSGRD